MLNKYDPKVIFSRNKSCKFASGKPFGQHALVLVISGDKTN